MIIKLELYKPTGKWYATDEAVDVGEVEPWKSEFYETIMTNQKAVNSPRNYIAVVDNVDDNDHFAKRLYMPTGI